MHLVKQIFQPLTKIKSDFHLHTNDDREDPIAHSAKELIDHAAKKGFGALAITNHNTFTYSCELQNYAEDNGILLIPGIEKSVEGKHVLILNAFPATEKINTFDGLRKAKEDGLFLIAPHPFFKSPCCLGQKLLEHLDLFDAIEFTHFYSKWFNLNRKVSMLSEQEGLPVVGNSDCHLLKYMGACHSILYSEEQSIEAIFFAIRNNQVEVVGQPIFMLKLAKILFEMWLSTVIDTLQTKMQPDILAPEKKAEEVCF